MNVIRLLLILLTLFSAKSLAVFSDNACRLGGSAFKDITNAITITETVDSNNDIKFSISFPKSIKEFEFDMIYLVVHKKEVDRIRKEGPQNINMNKVLTADLESTITGNIVNSSFTLEKEQLDLIDLTVYFLHRSHKYISDVPYCRYEIKQMIEKYSAFRIRTT